MLQLVWITQTAAPKRVQHDPDTAYRHTRSCTLQGKPPGEPEATPTGTRNSRKSSVIATANMPPPAAPRLACNLVIGELHWAPTMSPRVLPPILSTLQTRGPCLGFPRTTSWQSLPAG